MANSTDPIAIAIKQIMKEKGLLQGAVAKRAGFSEKRFSNMMNDRQVILACDLFPISQALGVVIPVILAEGKKALSDSEQKAG